MKYAFQIVVFFSSTPFGGNQLAVAHMRGRDAKLYPPAATPAKEGSRRRLSDERKLCSLGWRM